MINKELKKSLAQSKSMMRSASRMQSSRYDSLEGSYYDEEVDDPMLDSREDPREMLERLKLEEEAIKQQINQTKSIHIINQNHNSNLLHASGLKNLDAPAQKSETLSSHQFVNSSAFKSSNPFALLKKSFQDDQNQVAALDSEAKIPLETDAKLPLETELYDPKHIFTTEGGITNNTWEGEGGNPNLALPMEPEEFLIQVPSLDVDCKFRIDTVPTSFGWPVWQNPINVIERPICNQLGSYIQENVVCLPTMDKKVAKKAAKQKKQYALTIDEQIKRLENKEQFVPSDDNDGYITPLFEYIIYNSETIFKETIISEYLFKVPAFTFYFVKSASYSDGIVHYPAIVYTENAGGVKQSELLKEYFNELLGEDQQIEEALGQLDQIYNTSHSQEMYQPKVEALSEKIPTPKVQTPRVQTPKVQTPKVDDDNKIVKMLLSSIRQYEDLLYLKQYKDQKERKQIQDIITNLKSQLQSQTNEVEDQPPTKPPAKISVEIPKNLADPEPVYIYPALQQQPLNVEIPSGDIISPVYSSAVSSVQNDAINIALDQISKHPYQTIDHELPYVKQYIVKQSSRRKLKTVPKDLLTPEQQIEQNIEAIFHHYSKKPQKKGLLFEEIHEQDNYMMLQNFMKFYSELLSQVIKVPQAKMIEIFKKMCQNSKQIMNYDLFKQALLRVARLHISHQLSEAKKSLKDLDMTEKENKFMKPLQLAPITEVEEEETPMPKLVDEEQLNLQIILLELENVEASIKNTSDEKKDVLDNIELLQTQLEDDEYLYNLITVEILALDRALDQINMIYNTKITEYVKTPEIKSALKTALKPKSKTRKQEIDREQMRKNYKQIRDMNTSNMSQQKSASKISNNTFQTMEDNVSMNSTLQREDINTLEIKKNSTIANSTLQRYETKDSQWFTKRGDSRSKNYHTPQVEKYKSPPPLESQLSQFMRSRNDNVNPMASSKTLNPLPLIKQLPEDERSVIDKYLENVSGPKTTGRKLPGSNRYNNSKSSLKTLDQLPPLKPPGSYSTGRSISPYQLPPTDNSFRITSRNGKLTYVSDERPSMSIKNQRPNFGLVDSTYGKIGVYGVQNKY